MCNHSEKGARGSHVFGHAWGRGVDPPGRGFDARVLGLQTARAKGSHERSAVARSAKGKGIGVRTGIIVVVGLVPTTRRRCRSERGVDHAARRLNELDVDKVQPAAFTCRQRAALEGRAAAPSCMGTDLPARAESEPVCFACLFLPLTAPPLERLCANMPP